MNDWSGDRNLSERSIEIKMENREMGQEKIVKMSNTRHLIFTATKRLIR